MIIVSRLSKSPSPSQPPHQPPQSPSFHHSRPHPHPHPHPNPLLFFPIWLSYKLSNPIWWDTIAAASAPRSTNREHYPTLPTQPKLSARAILPCISAKVPRCKVSFKLTLVSAYPLSIYNYDWWNASSFPVKKHRVMSRLGINDCEPATGSFAFCPLSKFPCHIQPSYTAGLSASRLFDLILSLSSSIEVAFQLESDVR